MLGGICYTVNKVYNIFAVYIYVYYISIANYYKTDFVMNKVLTLKIGEAGAINPPKVYIFSSADIADVIIRDCCTCP